MFFFRFFLNVSVYKGSHLNVYGILSTAQI